MFFYVGFLKKNRRFFLGRFFYNNLETVLFIYFLAIYSLTFSHPAGFRDFRVRTTRSHMALHEHNSDAESGRELFKGSKDAASLLGRTQKTFFVWGFKNFCECHHKWWTFRRPWPTSRGPWPKPLDGSISLKFLLETGLQSKSFNTLDDLLGFQVQKLWSKVNKIFD